MLQHDHLFEWRSILKNVLLGAEINKSVSQETKQRAKELLRQYGLKRFINERSVDFPHPEGPTTTANSPGAS